MGAVYGINLAVLAVVVFLARGEGGEDWERVGGGVFSRKFFNKAAAFLYRILFRNFKQGGRKESRICKGKKEIAEDMRTLYPGKDRDKKMKAYYIEKIRMVLLVVFLGNTLALGVYWSEKQEGKVTEGGMVAKNTWQEGSFWLDLQAESKGKEKISVLIEPKSLEQKEAERLAEEVFQTLLPVMLKQNKETGRITKDLNLVTEWKPYPFRISWDISHPQIISPAGKLNNSQIDSGGEPVTVTPCLVYQDAWQTFRYRKAIELRVFPPDHSPEEKWREVLRQAIEDSQAHHACEGTLQLPQMIEGVTVFWKEQRESRSFYLWGMGWLTAMAFFGGKDRDLHKKAMERKRQLERDYPELVMKLVLYVGAGMTVKNAWKRMLQEDIPVKSGGRRTLYEEMTVSWHELENGVSEGEVYFRFGKRLGGSRYRRLSGLLCNHLQKGNKNLLQKLRQEADAALEERKNAARIVGEEMGTKLLFPMMLMLLIVMVIIVIPAFAMF